jgi:hypothetical protein
MRRKKVSSPLTDHLGPNFGGQRQRKKRVFIGAALLLLVPYIGSTLAATVTISGTGGTTAIEFGQGSQVAITCDTTITSSIEESWYATNSNFRVSTITLSGVDVRTNTSAISNDLGCGGKTMSIKLFTGAAGSQTPATIGDNATTATFTVPTATTNSFAISSPASSNITGSATVATVNGIDVATLVFTIPNTINLDASTVTRVSIETE